MSNERYILLIETRQEASPHNITILKNQVISLQSLFYHLGKLLKGLPKATSDNRRPYLRALFGDNIFSYEGVDLFNELSYVSPTDNASVFVKQSFIGHMSDKVAVIPVLNMFVSVLNQKTIIQQTYVHLENIYKDYPIDELKQVVEEIKPLIGLWKEKIKAYNNSNILFPYENAINILERIDELSKHIEDGKSVCRIITGLGYFAICFLSLTKKSYDYYYTDTVNVSEGEIITFKTVQVALPELLKSIKEFLEEPLSQSKLDRKEETFDKSGDDHTRTLGSTYEDHSNIPAARSRRTYKGFSQEMIEKIEEYVFYNMAKWLKESLTITQFESALRSFLQELYEDGILDIDYIEYAQNYGSHYYSLFHAVLECLKDLGRGYAKDLVEQYSKRLEQYEKTFAEEKFKESTKSNNNEENYERN